MKILNYLIMFILYIGIVTAAPLGSNFAIETSEGIINFNTTLITGTNIDCNNITGTSSNLCNAGEITGLMSSWNLAVNSGVNYTVSNGTLVNLIDGTGITITRSGGEVTITNTVTDTVWTLDDTYLNNVSGVLTFNETKLNATIDARDTDTTYTNGSGISLVGTQFNHSDTSSQSSSGNSGRTYIQDIFLDTFGHITSIGTATETVVDTVWSLTGPYIYNNSGSLDLNETKLNSTIDARDTDTTYTSLGLYILLSGTQFSLNETRLNATIDARDTDTTYTAGTGLDLTGTVFSLSWLFLSNFTDDLGDRGYTSLSNFTNDLGFINGTYANNTYILQSEEGNLNVNSSNYWDGLNTPLNILNMASVTFTNIFSSNWTNVTITESQISDLTHTVDTVWNITGSNYLINNSNILDVNETKLNATIEALDNDTTYTAGTGLDLTGTVFSLSWLFLSNFTDDLGDRGYTSLSNFTNDLGLINETFANATYILQSNEGNLNVNSSNYWDNIDTSNDFVTVTASSNITSNGFFSGQPLDGALGSGIIWAQNISASGLLKITDLGGLNFSYPPFLARIHESDNTVTYCNVTGGNLTAIDNQDSVYLINSACSIIPISLTVIGASVQTGEAAGLFRVFAHDGDIEIPLGLQTMNVETASLRFTDLIMDDLRIKSGLGIVTGVFPEFAQESGRYVFSNTVFPIIALNTTTDGVEYVYRSSGNWTDSDEVGINLSTCDNGTDLITCSDNLWRRYLIFSTGFTSNGDEFAKLHVLAASDSETFANVGDCVDTDSITGTPISFTLPNFYDFTAVKTFFYCDRPTNTDWSGSFVDLRVSGVGGLGGGVPDTSIFLTIDGSRSLTGNWDQGAFNLTNTLSWFLGLINASSVQNDVWIEDSQESILNVNSSIYLLGNITESQISDLSHIGNCSVDGSCPLITYDSEFDNASIIRNTTSAGGDLSGTYPNPEVVDDSHNHIYSNIDATSSSNWASIITDESGTGVFAFTISPIFTTPTLGVATATTLDTGQGANELYDMDQNVLTTSNVTYNKINITTNLTISGTTMYDNGTHIIWD